MALTQMAPSPMAMPLERVCSGKISPEFQRLSWNVCSERDHTDINKDWHFDQKVKSQEKEDEGDSSFFAGLVGRRSKLLHQYGVDC
jgi:hypothetical protein